jgi:hypothetical protein
VGSSGRRICTDYDRWQLAHSLYSEILRVDTESPLAINMQWREIGVLLTVELGPKCESLSEFSARPSLGSVEA